MDHYDEAWEYDPRDRAEFDEAFGPGLDPELDPDVDPEVLYLSLMAEEERRAFWPETLWNSPVDQGSTEDTGGPDDSQPELVAVGGPSGLVDGPAEAPLLFVDGVAEEELRREVRLGELWGRCQRVALPMAEFLELTKLVNEVEGLPDAICVDCALLARPTVRCNRALATTGLCRVHLRLKLGQAEIDHAQ